MARLKTGCGSYGSRVVRKVEAKGGKAVVWRELG